MGRILSELYFVTTTVVDWVDIFTRPKYKHIVIDSLAYCQQRKGLHIYAWVLMSNHLHMIISVDGQQTVGDVMRDFKKYTSRQVLEEKSLISVLRMSFLSVNDLPSGASLATPQPKFS